MDAPTAFGIRSIRTHRQESEALNRTIISAVIISISTFTEEIAVRQVCIQRLITDAQSVNISGISGRDVANRNAICRTGLKLYKIIHVLFWNFFHAARQHQSPLITSSFVPVEHHTVWHLNQTAEQTNRLLSKRIVRTKRLKPYRKHLKYFPR